ncbi:carbohydrate-binding module family 18 protein [Trichoderma citrinoviride]|uniref:Carbohydrate-binding module family 18 protein n=1 Tax=Trichoderma citrinoviride TaxID=58853 RepID=A0A2T4B762_9HYPO|nr:carbohydrate-binding module family 18 protein [Trichoderma citrinoviride]PTB65069.1 carbohydrate-binding module family 18 protein [Trichoderma citrinoviride]
MKSHQRTFRSRHLVSWAIAFWLTATVHASDQCAPSIWQPGQFEDRFPVVSGGNVTTGTVNCRYAGNTEGMDINYYTCTALAVQYGISVDTFFMLNPDVNPDCSNIKADTDYCVSGFIEPARATDGLCGPQNSNATCLGTEFQCCNSKTWKCGNSTEDCADGTCYEGACAGDSIFTTTGECGQQHGYKQCAGVWGDCCNADGKCGTGEDFCGYGVCQLGNCTVPSQPPGPPSWLNGNTTDGTCGGTNRYTCSVVYGNCCNKDGICGSLVSDCGDGCQPEFGNCTTPNTGSSSSSSSSKASSASTKVTTSSHSTTVSSKSSTPSSKPASTSATTTTSAKPPSTSIPGEAALPSCGQLCFNNMLAQYSALGCNALDAYCLCNNVDFSNGLRDCSNGACGTAVASTVIAFGSSYCSTAFATHTPTTTGVGALPSCGQTCFNNMLAQYSQLGCPSPQDSYCLCNNVDFSNGLRDCSNGACGTAVASTVIAFGSAYCSTASATHTAAPTGIGSLPACGQTCFNNMLAQYSQLGCSSPDPRCLCENVNFGYGLRDCSNGACGTAVASTVIAYGSSYCASATASP